MLKIHKYLFKNLVTTWFFATFGFFCLSVLLNALTFLDNVIVDNWSLWLVIKLVGYGMPTAVHTVLPTTLFLSLIVVYWQKIKDKELAVMRAAGLSYGSLALPAVLMSLAVIVLAMVLGWYVNVYSAKGFRIEKQSIASNAGASILPTGSFVQAREGILFYANRKSLDGKYLGVLIQDSRSDEQTTVVTAKKAEILAVTGGYEITLFDAVRYSKTKGADFVNSVSFDRHRFETLLPQSTEQSFFYKPRELDFAELAALLEREQAPAFWPSNKATKFTQMQQEYRAEFYNRLLHPLRYLGVLALALLVLFGSETGRSDNRQRLYFGTTMFVFAEVWAVMLQTLASNFVQVFWFSFIANSLLLVGVLLYYVLQHFVLRALPVDFFAARFLGQQKQWQEPQTQPQNARESEGA